MKNRFESAEIFTAYATIEAGYYMMQKLGDSLSTITNASPIARMVDEASGYGAAKTKEAATSAIGVLTEIIEAKKLIEADYSADTALIEKIKPFA